MILRSVHEPSSNKISIRDIMKAHDQSVRDPPFNSQQPHYPPSHIESESSFESFDPTPKGSNIIDPIIRAGRRKKIFQKMGRARVEPQYSEDKNRN